MDYGEKVAWLRRYQDSLRRERVLVAEIERLRAEAERVTPALTGLPGGGPSADRLPRAVERIDEARQELAAQVERCQAARAEVKQIIDQTSETLDREILSRRYILGQQFEEISAEISMEYRWVRRRHKRAVSCINISSDF